MRKSFLFLALAAAVALTAAAEDFEVSGQALTSGELFLIEGGEVIIRVNADRNRAEVTLIDERGECEKIRRYEVPVSCNVLDDAKYMPTETAIRDLYSDGWTASQITLMRSTPERFPKGMWSITGVEAISGEYGPYKIRTNAVGNVSVTLQEGGSQYFVGVHEDMYYQGHSNKSELEGKTLGCVLFSKFDNERVARDLMRDRERGGKQWWKQD